MMSSLWLTFLLFTLIFYILVDGMVNFNTYKTTVLEWIVTGGLVVSVIGTIVTTLLIIWT